jgi:phage protein D
MSDARASAAVFKVKLKGSELDAGKIHDWYVELDLDQPDMCALTLHNEDHANTAEYKLGDELEITVGDGDEKVFTGEVAALEPSYRSDGENTLTLRAFNKLHRLLRGRKSRTFLDQTDKDIVGAVAGDHGLSPKCGDASIRHEHVYQHNQTDLEFLRVRAARLGFEVWVVGNDLHFDAPKTDEDSGVTLRYGNVGDAEGAGADTFKNFWPKMSSAQVVKKVEVRAWDPEKKEPIVGTAEQGSSRLGSTDAAAAISTFGTVETFTVDHPVASVDEANKLAAAKLAELNMEFISGVGECRGNPAIKPGAVITVTVNPDKSDDPFNGKHMVVGATHRYNPTGGDEGGGVITQFRVRRDAREGS